MVDHGLLTGHRLILANSATASRNADIEDLFSERDYLKLFNKAFGTSLKVKDLPPGDRIVKRLESKQGSYVHGEVAETLLRNHSGIEFANETLDRFAKLNVLLNSTVHCLVGIDFAVNQSDPEAPNASHCRRIGSNTQRVVFGLEPKAEHLTK